MSTFWHCFVGIDRNGKPTTADRSSVRHKIGAADGSTLRRPLKHPGCMRLPAAFRIPVTGQRNFSGFGRLTRIISALRHDGSRWGEYLLRELTGKGAESISMMSASGIWDQRQNDYCLELLQMIGIEARANSRRSKTLIKTVPELYALSLPPDGLCSMEFPGIRPMATGRATASVAAAVDRTSSR